jgi:secreted Zn-dependent insulinase-like peptidase
MHLTNYKFEVIADKAEKAVDIFSNFFVAPLFTSSGTSREVQAVDSENSKNLTADARRRLQILKALADPRHYFSKFSTGNSRTLPTNDPEKLDWIREALLAFHRKHYRPENMTVCIAGPQSIEILSEWVTSRYSQIKSQPFPASDQPVMTRVEQLVDAAARDAPPYTFQEKAPPYSPPFRSSLQGSWPVLLTTKPLRSMRKLVMMWPLPSDRKTPDRAPSSMLSHLLGHEGVGSAFAALQNAGLLSALSAGPRTKSPDFTLFQVDMTLTEKGEKNWQSVVNVIFAYCRLLATKASDNDGIETLKRIWGETSDLDRMFFHQTSPGGVYSYAPTIADRVVAHGTEACLSAGNMLNENKDTFPVEDFGKFAELLSPENCIIERCSESAYEEMQQQTNFDEGYGLQNEKWYGVEYFLSPIDSMSTSAWKGLGKLANPIETDELRLPSPNRYIPRTLELCPDLPQEARIGQRIEKPIDPPNLLIHDKNWKLYHRLDDRYALPQSSLHLLIRNIAVQSVKSGDEWTFDARASLLSSIVAGIFNEAMAQETYDADLAGLHWSMNATAAGIKLNCFGFSDRLPDLGLKVLSDFLSGDFLDERFFISSRDRVVRGLRTYFESRRADAHAMYYRDSLLATQDKGIDESLELAVSMKFEDVVQHHRAILKHNHVSAVDCLFSGNVSSRDAALFFAEARSKINSAQAYVGENNQSSQVVIPAPSIERLVNPGNEIQLHFASKNPAEENGAVLVTYQSSIPSFKGQVLSQPESLLSSSAIRLLCHMLREPLFDELRTKQQLGYIVSSYHEIGHSFCLNQSIQAPCTTPVDFISINILSRKVPPTQIIERIDEFLGNFRRSLETMPESEIKDHSDALATKLLKPIQKLQTESSSQFSRIQRYGPEVFSRNANSDDSIPGSSFDDGMPWETAPELAVTIRQLTRKDLLQVWDRMTQPSTRCRVVSCVYGKTFPLSPSNNDLEARGAVGFSSFWNQSNSVKVVNDFPNLLKLREGLPHYGPQGATISAGRKMYTRLGSLLKPDHRMKLVGIGVLGAAMIGSALVSTESNRKRRAPNGNAKMLASSVFFLVAMALPAIGTSSTTLPVAFLGTSLLCNAYTGQRPFERTKSVVVNGDDGVKSRVCQSWELDFSEQDIEETSSRAPSAIGRREVLLSMAAAALMYPTTAHGAEKRDRVQTKTLDDLQFGSARWSPLTDAFNNEDDENESLNGGTDRRNVKASQRADSGVSNIAVPASFATYLTRVLINYDEGVSSWWQSRLHSYSLLPFDQQQTRLGQDFGKLSASIQRALQGYMEDKAGATPPRNVYEDIFERLMRSVDGSLDKDEGKRQLLLLAATLPADHQPVGAIKELLANLSTRSALPPNQISNENVMKEDLSALLPETYTVISRSDGTVTLSPQVSFFEVGVGEEFGQAATATTFGPVAATELTRDLPQYTFDIYALFGISGATGCCLTHSLGKPQSRVL